MREASAVTGTVAAAAEANEQRRGGQIVLTLEQEVVFAQHLLTCADALWIISLEQLKSYI